MSRDLDRPFTVAERQVIAFLAGLWELVKALFGLALLLAVFGVGFVAVMAVWGTVVALVIGVIVALVKGPDWVLNSPPPPASILWTWAAGWVVAIIYGVVKLKNRKRKGRPNTG